MRPFLINKIIYIPSLIGILLGVTELPNFDTFDWDEIRKDKITIQYYQENDIQWCRAYTESDYSIEQISKVLEDKASYPNVFDRITETILYAEDIVHIKLDMPFPWSGRDYIVKYSEFSSNNIKEYKWMYYDDLNIPVDDDYVRLSRAAGKWKLVKLENGKTQIEYIWNGELLGDFPKWALKIAWKEQGTEVLTWLINYMDNQ